MGCRLIPEHYAVIAIASEIADNTIIVYKICVIELGIVRIRIHRQRLAVRIIDFSEI